MAKQRLWYKKRTTRGGGRKFSSKARLNPKNLNREVFKNQKIYSYFLLKFVLFMLLGLTWLRLGAVVGSVEVIPIGFAIGLIIAIFERFRIGRRIELLILVSAMVVSYFLPVGIVI